MSEPLSARLRSTWWGKMAACVLVDRSLRDSDVRVFGIIALKVRKGRCVVSIGARFIAEELGWSHGKVERSITRLIKAGHLLKVEDKRGRRGNYELMSWVYKNPVRVAGKLTITPASGVPVQVEGEFAPAGAGVVRGGARRKAVPKEEDKATA